MKEVHIDTTGMTEDEKIFALITEIFKHVTIQRKKKKAKQIRAENRITDKERKRKKKSISAKWR